jgi:hypothetical protein
MTEINHIYTWADYSVKINMESTLEESFKIQAWCIAYLGNRWATTPPVGDTSVWYFIDEGDATLFRLRWL